MAQEKYCLGIDFGTTNSKLAYWFFEQPCVIRNDAGEANTPSVVHFKDDGTVIVGREAKENLIPFPERTIASVKRKMGSRHRYNVDGEKYPPEYVGALIFRHLMDLARSQTGIDFADAVVSVPANFSDAQRSAIKDAAEIAGLNVTRMINEPTAAALAYGLRAAEGEKKTILLYDFGGGTFDVSILTVSDNFFNVEASDGIKKCGGDDIDSLLTAHLGQIIECEHKVDINQDLKTLQMVRAAAEQAKIVLSEVEQTTVNIPFLVGKSHEGPVAFSCELTRATLNSVIADLIQSTKMPVVDVLQRAGLSFADIDDVILVGGTTKIPAVKAFVEGLTGKPPLCYIDPYEVVAMGAAVASMEGTGVRFDQAPSGAPSPALEISDVVSHSFGIHVFPENVEKIVEKNEKLPICKSKPFTNIYPYTPELEIEVYEGERETTVSANRIGAFFIDVVPRPAGENQITVSFEIGTEYGILDVTARDKETGIERKVRMEAKSRLTNQEKLKWAKKLANGNILTVVVQDDARKVETALIFNPNRTICDVMQRLQQRRFIPTTESNQFLLYHEKQALLGSEALSEFVSGNEVYLSLRNVDESGDVHPRKK